MPYTQTATVQVAAPRDAVFAALVDPRAIELWRTPDDMTSDVLTWDAVPGGRFRVSLTYDRGQAGKTEGATDTYSGRFEDIVAGERVVEVIEFESDDAALAGEMTVTTTLRDGGGGTEVELTHEGIPDAVPPDQNELGTRMSLAKLAAYVERGSAG